MTRVDSPQRAAARATVALTTVLPTPPFPATMSSRDAAKKRAGSTTDEATEGRSGRRNRRCRPADPRSPPAAAAREPAAGDGYVAVIEVSGLLDEVLVDFVETQIADAEDAGALALVLQLNSAGAVVSDDRLDALVERIATADVPVDVWVGPVGQPGHRRGHRPAGGRPRRRRRPAAVGWRSRPRLLGDGTLDGEAAVGDKVSAGEAVDLGLVDNAAPTIGVFVYGDAAGSRASPASRRPSSPASASPSPRPASASSRSYGQLLHTVASPPVAYLLFLIGLALIVFELYTAGVGVAGLVGAGCLILGCYGLAALPTNPVAVGLLLFAMFGFAVDVQTGRAPGVERHRHRVARPSDRCSSTTGSRCRGSPCSWPSAGSPSP